MIANVTKMPIRSVCLSAKAYARHTSAAHSIRNCRCGEAAVSQPSLSKSPLISDRTTSKMAAIATQRQRGANGCVSRVVCGVGVDQRDLALEISGYDARHCHSASCLRPSSSGTCSTGSGALASRSIPARTAFNTANIRETMRA